jgi:hypothetical protein
MGFRLQDEHTTKKTANDDRRGAMVAEQQNREHIARSVWSASGSPALSSAGNRYACKSAGEPDALHTLRAASSQPAWRLGYSSGVGRALGVLICFGLLVAGTGAAEKAKEEKAAEPAKGEKSAEAPSRVKRGANGEVIVTLDAATQQVMGLETATLETAQLSPEIKGYGRVLDSSALASQVAELITAQAAGEASQAELKRVKSLAAQNNASERSLQAAVAAAVRDQAQVESARLRLLANWGSAMAERQDLSGFVHSLGSLSNALVEVDVPPGQPLTNSPTGARLLILSDYSQPISAQYLGQMPVVDSQMQARGFLFLVSPNPLRLAPGAAVSGFVSMPGEPVTGVLVPRNAVVRFNGTAWVYLQTGAETFQRTEIALDRPLENGWFLRDKLKPQDKVVSVGAQQLLSEERKGGE